MYEDQVNSWSLHCHTLYWFKSNKNNRVAMRRKTKMQIMAFSVTVSCTWQFSYWVFFFINRLLDKAEYDLKNYADRRGC